MKECVFCNIVKTGNNNNEKEKNIILYEDNLLLITQATGSPVRGYLIKAEGKHYYESLTACSTKILRMLYSMCKNNKQFLEN